MEPLEPRGPRLSRGFAKQTQAKPSTLKLHVDRRIENEPVSAPVPRDVDEPDETRTPIRGDVHQAAPENGLEVTDLVRRPCACEERVQRSVSDRRTSEKDKLLRSRGVPRH